MQCRNQSLLVAYQHDIHNIAELFEVRKPKETAIISEIDGSVSFGKYTKGKRKMIITPEVGEPKSYLVPRGKHVSVLEGDYVRAGEALMDGSADPHDILKIRGLKELAKYLVHCHRHRRPCPCHRAEESPETPMRLHFHAIS